MQSLSLLVLLTAAFASTASAQACLAGGVTEGGCQGIYYCWVETAGDSIDCEFDIYDSNCNQIASDVNPNVGDAIDSELRWTVDLTELHSVTVPNAITAQWAYAGSLYGAGASAYSTGTFTSGLSGGAWMRAGFECNP